ncbi:MAG: class I SAM-dependent methyltransferase [Erysipelotrichia bacterium]|nr:class I SAM-dependent methyltransferase [Erysipelotrichia bacterium]
MFDKVKAIMYSCHMRERILNYAGGITQKPGISLLALFYARFPWLLARLRFLKTCPGTRYLDFGCGSGVVLRQNLLVRRDLEVFAVDVVDHSADMPETASFALYDGCHIPFKDDEFELVTANHVFEHIPDPKKLLKELFRVMKSGGRLYLETPNQRSLSRSCLRGRFAGTVHFYDDSSHITPMNAADLAKLGREVGFEVLKDGVSRNWLHFILSPVFLLVGLCMPDRLFFMYARNAILGWASYAILEKPRFDF